MQEETMTTFFALKTTRLDKPMYFAGVTENFEKPCICLTDYVFAAYDFETVEAAKKCSNGLGLKGSFDVVELTMPESVNL